MNRYQTTFNTWDKIASLYQQYFMDVDLYDDTYDSFCNAVKKQQAAILEIGCGPGNITKYLLAKRNDFAIDATDISPNMIALAKQNNPSANCMVMDARDIHTITKKFDGIMCGFCMPYLSKKDSEKLIQDCFFLLDKGGIFYCSVIEDDHNRSGYETNSNGDKAYVYYYEQDFMTEHLTKAGFSDIHVIRKAYNKKEDSKQTHLILIASK